jgi:hypothetical protein
LAIHFHVRSPPFHLLLLYHLVPLYELLLLCGSPWLGVSFLLNEAGDISEQKEGAKVGGTYMFRS